MGEHDQTDADGISRRRLLKSGVAATGGLAFAGTTVGHRGTIVQDGGADSFAEWVEVVREADEDHPLSKLDRRALATFSRNLIFMNGGLAGARYATLEETLSTEEINAVFQEFGLQRVFDNPGVDYPDRECNPPATCSNSLTDICIGDNCKMTSNEFERRWEVVRERGSIRSAEDFATLVRAVNQRRVEDHPLAKVDQRSLDRFWRSLVFVHGSLASAQFGMLKESLSNREITSLFREDFGLSRDTYRDALGSILVVGGDGCHCRPARNSICLTQQC